MTGMRVLKKIQYDTIDKAELKRFLEERIKEEVKPEELRAEELALKKFGLVPQDFDLKTTTVDLLTEQAAAFYDYRKKKLFLMEEATGTQNIILIHELAHALADQHVDLGKFLRKGKSDDSALARMAVMEGQATWLMYESMVQRMGQSLRSAPSLVEAMSRGSDALTSQYPVLSSAPLYIRQSLLFPYMRGMRFQHAVIQKYGQDGFTKVFRDPPAGSHHILHPELYFSGGKPVAPDLPKVAGEWKTLAEGSVGEFDHAILLEQYGGKPLAEELAPMWRGGAMQLLERKAEARVVLVYASEWADEAAAKRMFDAYRQVLKGKWKKLKIDEDAAGAIAGTGDDGIFRVECKGTRLTSVEGLPALD